MRQKDLIVGVCALFLGVSLGCKSEFSEKSPDGYAQKDGTLSLQDRLSNNRSLDQKLNDIDNTSKEAKEIISLFRQFKKGNGYTPVDLLSDLTRELKKGIPDSQAGYTKQASFSLPASNLTPECRRVDAIFNVPQRPEGADADNATIALRTCKSNGQFIEAFILTWKNGNLADMKIKDDALRELFPQMVGGEVGKINEACQFNKNDKGSVRSVYCQNLSVPINDVDTAVLDTLNYDLDGANRLEVVGSIYEMGKLKLMIHFKTDKNGVPLTPEIVPGDDSGKN